MATNTNPVVNASPNLKPQTQVWGTVMVTKKVKNADGSETVTHDLKAIQGEKEVQKAEEDNILVTKQTFGFDFPANDAGQKEVIPDDEERNDTFIAGLKASRISPRIRRMLEEYNEKTEDGFPIPVFSGVEGIYDFRDEIKEEAKRKNLTPLEKALKNLRAIPMFAALDDASLMKFLGNAEQLLAQSQPENSSEESDAVAETATA